MELRSRTGGVAAAFGTLAAVHGLVAGGPVLAVVEAAGALVGVALVGVLITAGRRRRDR
jgi:hypothetical protein